MMSPYEGERIFEAEMVRLHQCDRHLYACSSSARQANAPRLSWRQWLLGVFGAKTPPEPGTADAATEIKL